MELQYSYNFKYMISKLFLKIDWQHQIIKQFRVRILLQKRMIKEDANLSVLSCGSIDKNWQKKPKKPILSKIIKRDIGDFALILTEDPSKPLRFLYLSLLTDKNRLQHMKSIIMKIKRIKQSKTQLQFEDLSLQMQQINTSMTQILKNLKILQMKMQKSKDDELIAAKLCQQHMTVDPLLTLTFRAIAHSQQCRIKGALSCGVPLSLANIYDILRKFGIEKNEKNQLNRFVLFRDLKQIDVQFFKSQGISIENEQTNCSELFDAYLLNYEQQLVLEQLYSDL